MIGRAVVAADLDRTLIYSKGALALSQGSRPSLVVAETDEGRAAAFMTATAADLLTDLALATVLVPVTTRTPKQFARVTLPGRAPRYAIAANGGFLFVDGRLDRSWQAHVRQRLSAVAPLAEVWAHVGRVLAAEWTVKLRNADGMFCYAVIDRSAMPPQFLDDVTAWAADRGWSTSLQGRKLYWVPRTLTKSAAVEEVARRTDAATVLAAGDSLLDIDMLLAADRGIHPAHGEIADSGWRAPHVVSTAAVGVLAGEEICRWLTAEAATFQRDGVS